MDRASSVMYAWRVLLWDEAETNALVERITGVPTYTGPMAIMDSLGDYLATTGYMWYELAQNFADSDHSTSTAMSLVVTAVPMLLASRQRRNGRGRSSHVRAVRNAGYVPTEQPVALPSEARSS